MNFDIIIYGAIWYGLMCKSVKSYGLHLLQKDALKSIVIETGSYVQENFGRNGADEAK